MLYFCLSKTQSTNIENYKEHKPLTIYKTTKSMRNSLWKAVHCFPSWTLYGSHHSIVFWNSHKLGAAARGWSRECCARAAINRQASALSIRYFHRFHCFRDWNCPSREVCWSKILPRAVKRSEKCERKQLPLCITETNVHTCIVVLVSARSSS